MKNATCKRRWQRSMMLAGGALGIVFQGVSCSPDQALAVASGIGAVAREFDGRNGSNDDISVFDWLSDEID